MLDWKTMKTMDIEAKRWLPGSPLYLLIFAFTVASCGHSETVKPYEVRMVVPGGEYAPDTITVNGKPVEISSTREKKSANFDFREDLYDIVSETPIMVVEWKEGGDVFRAELLLDSIRKPEIGYISITTNRWREAHKHLDLAKVRTLTLGGIQLKNLTINNVPIPKKEAVNMLPGTD